MESWYDTMNSMFTKQLGMGMRILCERRYEKGRIGMQAKGEERQQIPVHCCSYLHGSIVAVRMCTNGEREREAEGGGRRKLR